MPIRFRRFVDLLLLLLLARFAWLVRRDAESFLRRLRRTRAKGAQMRKVNDRGAAARTQAHEFVNLLGYSIRRGNFASFLVTTGYVVLIATFIIKEGLREGAKDTLDDMTAAMHSYAICRDIRLVSDPKTAIESLPIDDDYAITPGLILTQIKACDELCSHEDLIYELSEESARSYLETVKPFIPGLTFREETKARLDAAYHNFSRDSFGYKIYAIQYLLAVPRSSAKKPSSQPSHRAAPAPDTPMPPPTKAAFMRNAETYRRMLRRVIEDYNGIRSNMKLLDFDIDIDYRLKRTEFETRYVEYKHFLYIVFAIGAMVTFIGRAYGIRDLPGAG